MSVSDFEILEKLGEGTYSIVYKVKRKADNKIYALKKVKLLSLNNKEKENALTEVRILASVNHPNVIAYKQAFLEETTSSLCIVMEYADDGDLLNKVQNCKKNNAFLEESELWEIFLQALQGLKALHSMRIMHRDIKSANVFLVKDGGVKLGDLNVAKVTKGGLVYTQTGTPYYASPEVWKDQPYDFKSDIWSLGCVIYEAAALHPPFRAKDMKGLYRQVIKGEFPPLRPEYSLDLTELLGLLLKVNPLTRPSFEQILSLSLVKRRMNNTDSDQFEGKLLRTLHVPKKLNVLRTILPAANYEPLAKPRYFSQEYRKSPSRGVFRAIEPLKPYSDARRPALSPKPRFSKNTVASKIRALKNQLNHVNSYKKPHWWG